MAFAWEEQVYCGDETGPSECPSKNTTKTGKSLVVSDSNGGCDADLVGDQYPSIAVSRSNSVTEQRSGSGDQPIKLPLLLEQPGGMIPTIVTKRSDGVIVAWRPVKMCYNQKLIVNPNGGIVAMHDVNSNVFESSCVGSLDDATHIAASAAFTDCDGIVRYRQIFVDKEAFLTDLIQSGAVSFTDLTASGLVTAGSLQVGTHGTPIKGILSGIATLTFGSTPGTLGAGESSIRSIAVPFAGILDTAFVSTQVTLPKGLFLKNAAVNSTGQSTAAATVALAVENVTAAPITLVALPYRAIVFQY